MTEKEEYEQYLKEVHAERSAWDEYVKNHAEQQELDRTMPDTMGKASTLLLQGASHDFADEIAGGAGALTGTPYREGRDAYREKVNNAREDLGIPGVAVETLGNVLSTAALPELRAGKAATEIGLGIAQGIGSADEMEDIPQEAGISGGISAATQAITKGAGKILGMNDPNKKLARVAGARGIDFKKKGIEGWGPRETQFSPDKVAKDLDQLGFFRQGDVVMDVNSGKFKPNPVGGRLDNFFKPQSIDDLHNRAYTAITALKEQNNRLLKGKVIKMGDLADTLKDAVNDYIPDGYGYDQRSEAAQSIVRTLLTDLDKQGKIKRQSLGGLMNPVKQGQSLAGSNMVVDAADVEGIKKQLYDQIKQTFTQGKTANDLGLTPEAQRKFSAKIDKLVDKFGGPDYARNNDIMAKLKQTADTIFEKGSREAGYGFEGPRLTMGSQIMNGIKDATINNAPMGVGMARMGQLPDSAPGAVMRNYVERFPTEAINSGRKPQSVQNIPEDLIRTPLPRTTDGLMKNKNFVLAKVAQMAPDMFEAVKDTYDHDPEMLSEIAPVLAQKMPQFFQRDKYNRFDGRIMNEADKQRAIKDTLSDPKLNSIRQAEIITKLNKDGIYDNN